MRRRRRGTQRKCSEPTNTGCTGGFPYSLSANYNFPLTRDMTTFWAPSALLITIRHARRFVCAGFSRKQATDHNHSTNHNRSSKQMSERVSSILRTAGDVCDVESRFMDYGLSNASINKCFALIHAEWKKNRGIFQALRCLAP